MDFRLDQSTVLAIIWFFIGFGTGLALLRFWKILLVIVIVAVLAPFIISLAGLNVPISSEQIINAFVNGLNMLASILASNPFAAIGFVIGVALGVITFVLRTKG